MLSSLAFRAPALRLGVAGRLYLIGALALVAVLSLAGAAIYLGHLTGHAAQWLYERGLVSVVEAAELELLLEKHRRIIESAPLELDRARLRKDKRSADDLVLRIDDIVNRSAHDIMTEVRTHLPPLMQAARDVMHFAENFAQDKSMEAVDRYILQAERLQDVLRRHRAERLKDADHQTGALADNGRRLVDVVAGIALGAVLLIGPLSLLLIRRLVTRLNFVTNAMARLAHNDTSVSVREIASADEVGEMARAIEVFKSNAVTLLDQKARLEQLNLWLDVALNNMARGLSMFDAGPRLVVCNSTYARMYDLPVELTRPGTSFQAIIEHRKKTVRSAESVVVDKDSYDVAGHVARIAALRDETRRSQVLEDGRVIEVTVKPIEAGGWVAVHEDVTEQRQAAERIARLARHDTLTGLANRLLFREELDRAWAGLAAGRRFALLCIDLDLFKDVNDTLGHPAGDALLKAVAVRLSETSRATDIIARLGGDEFAIIQAGAQSPDEARVLAKRIIEAVARPFQIQGHSIRIGATIGIALAPDDASNADALLKNADMALYRAKSDGRGRYSFFELAMEGRLLVRRMLENDLQRAVEANQFELHYQPIVDLASRRIVSCEALIRWRHPDRGMVSPAEFVPLAESTGLISDIGAWALQAACAEAARWPEHVKVAVNLSPVQLKGPDIARLAEEALAASGLPAARLELEVTETALLDNDAATTEVLHRVHALGIHIALDDFGTGYSSLSYLRSFPFDKIKIDQTFVRDVSKRRDCVAIVAAVAQLARSLDMATVAEGVETEDHLAQVRIAGCTQVQGYLFSRPVPAADILAVIADCDRRLDGGTGMAA